MGITGQFHSGCDPRDLTQFEEVCLRQRSSQQHDGTIGWATVGPKELDHRATAAQAQAHAEQTVAAFRGPWRGRLSRTQHRHDRPLP